MPEQIKLTFGENEARRKAQEQREAFMGQTMTCGYCGQRGIMGKDLDGCVSMYIYPLTVTAYSVGTRCSDSGACETRHQARARN